jgi:integrase
MKLGEWGKITLTGEVQGDDGKWRKAPAGTRKMGRWRARAKVRDHDGQVRDVERYDETKAKAERSLLDHLRERVAPAPADAVIKPDTLVKDAALVWQTGMLGNSDLALNSRRVYDLALRNHVVGPADDPSLLAHLTVREVKVSHVERFLRGVSQRSGPSAERLARRALKGVLDLAVKHDAIPLNPVVSAGRVSSPSDRKETAKDPRRAFTREERDALIVYADGNARAQSRDLADLAAFMAGTGARIGEACALRWSALDLDKGTAKLGPKVIRVKGQGLRIEERGKTKASTRTVRLPEWLVVRLLSRSLQADSNEWDVVFTSPRGQLRDPSNSGNDFRDLFRDAGRDLHGDENAYDWASPHTFRKTVATFLDEAGFSGREAANQLGHERASMTIDNYMDRRTVNERAAEVL